MDGLFHFSRPEGETTSHGSCMVCGPTQHLLTEEDEKGFGVPTVAKRVKNPTAVAPVTVEARGFDPQPGKVGISMGISM